MSLRELIRHNLGLKIFACVLAMLSWFTIRFAAYPELGLALNPWRQGVVKEFPNRPIQVLKSPDDPRTFTVNPAIATIRVSGDPRRMAKLTPEDIRLFVNLVDATDAQMIERRIQAYCPPGITIERIAPLTARIRLE